MINHNIIASITQEEYNTFRNIIYEATHKIKDNAELSKIFKHLPRYITIHAMKNSLNDEKFKINLIKYIEESIEFGKEPNNCSVIYKLIYY